MARRADHFVSIGLDALPADARARNGEYRGSLPVRILPAGVSGHDLSAARHEKPAPGQIWRRGDLRVRIVRVELNSVTYRELRPPRALRRLAKSFFLRTSLREVL